MSNEHQEQILDALKKAMEAELTGHHFYRTAAETTQDEQGKETFARLAQEELYHFRYLQRQYKSVLEDGNFDFSIKMEELEGEEPSSIFSPQLKKRIKESHFEVSALGIGMQLELNAVNFYRKCSEDATDPQVKKFFDELVEWEQGHYNDFAEELETLKEEYWDANDFIPM